MGFLEAVKHVYGNYLSFQGRARRSEYWWWVLFNILAMVLIAMIELTLGLGRGMMMAGEGMMSASYSGGPLSLIWALINFLPGLAVGVRRLHDTDKSGWWLLIGLVPLVGAIVLLVFFCSRGTAGPNRFGADPLAERLA
ncbi:DUF805 domain-containing protein [Xinfangfangia pollutisoli]|uniref:DUF805 domain-containing protein n=1 Tax=Xinfangfangia pollutisoli TaxID=2865960 RepID=UPI001CD55FE7|nr:DUF805 domain-containing protein [Xinfangfangia pollutisoli]